MFPFSVTATSAPVSAAVFSMSRCSAWNADDSMAGVLSAAPLTVVNGLSCALRRDSTASGGGSVTPPVSAGCPAEAGRLPIARRRAWPSCGWMGVRKAVLAFGRPVLDRDLGPAACGSTPCCPASGDGGGAQGAGPPAVSARRRRGCLGVLRIGIEGMGSRTALPHGSGGGADGAEVMGPGTALGGRWLGLDRGRRRTSGEAGAVSRRSAVPPAVPDPQYTRLATESLVSLFEASRKRGGGWVGGVGLGP